MKEITRAETVELIRFVSNYIAINSFDKHPGRLQDKMIIKLAYILQRVTEEYEIKKDTGEIAQNPLDLITEFQDQFEEDLIFNEL